MQHILRQLHHDVIGNGSFFVFQMESMSCFFSKAFRSGDWWTLLSWFDSFRNRFDDCIITHSDLYWEKQYRSNWTNGIRRSANSFRTTTWKWWIKRRPTSNSSRIRKFPRKKFFLHRYFSVSGAKQFAQWARSSGRNSPSQQCYCFECSKCKLLSTYYSKRQLNVSTLKTKDFLVGFHRIRLEI